jgi:hypothetical protein
MMRALGLLAMVVGVLGGLVCLALVGATWFGRGVANEHVADAVARLDAQLQEAITAIDQANMAVGDARTRLQQFAVQARQLAQSPTLGQQAADALRRNLNEQLGDDIARVRESFTRLRERAQTFNELVTLVDRMLPGVDLPSLPVDELQGIDRQLSQLDIDLAALRGDPAADPRPIANVLQDLAARVERLDARLEALSTALLGFTGRLNNARAAVERVGATVRGSVTLSAALVTLLWLYGLLLHVVLFLSGLRWFRIRPSPAPALAAGPPSEVGVAAQAP